MRRLSTLLVLRFLLVANALLLAALGLLFAIFASRPQGPIVAGVLWAAAAALLVVGVPLTDPYRRERRGRR